MDIKNTPSLETLLAQADHFIEEGTGAVVPPIQASTTFARDADYDLPGAYSYTRSTNPTTRRAEQLIARMEGARDARLFASGMAAFTGLVESFQAGDRIVAPRIMYHGGQDWLRHVRDKRGIAVDFFDPADPDALEQTLRSGPCALAWIETPVNPTWDVIDIARAVELAHDTGSLVGVDSTVAPPVTTRPLELGADFVFHSATKYLNGHSDVTGGVLAARAEDERWDAIGQARLLLGSIMAPFEAWLLVRGLRTLSVRYAKACENALLIARHFERHPKLEQVLYPGLDSHPGHLVAARQMTGGFGGMLSLLVKGGEDEAKRVAGKAQVFLRATSLGGVESLIEHRATVEGEHSVVPKNLLRLSVGIENSDDLIADLEQALG